MEKGRSEIKRNQWHFSWFQWSVEVLDLFSPTRAGVPSRFAMYEDGANLCQYLRTIALGGIVVPAGHLAVAGLWIAAFTIYPAYVFGLFSYATFIGSIVCGVAIIVGAIFALCWFWHGLKQGGNALAVGISSRAAHVANRVRERRFERGPGMASLIFQFVRDQHNRVCRNFTFVTK